MVVKQVVVTNRLTGTEYFNGSFAEYEKWRKDNINYHPMQYNSYTLLSDDNISLEIEYKY